MCGVGPSQVANRRYLIKDPTLLNLLGSSFSESSKEADVPTEVFELIQHFQKNPTSQAFAYAVNRSDTKDSLYNSYKLKLVPYGVLNTNKPYYTISASVGVEKIQDSL